MIGAVEPTMKLQFVEELQLFLICFLNEQRWMCVMFLGYGQACLFLHTELYRCMRLQQCVLDLIIYCEENDLPCTLYNLVVSLINYESFS
jgi:hypothetical protein